MKLRVRREDGGFVALHLGGEMTIGPDLDLLRDTVEDQLEEGARALVLEMGDLRYVDSAALGEMVACRRRATNAGAGFGVAGAQGKVRDMLRLTRLDVLIDVYRDLDEAWAALSA